MAVHQLAQLNIREVRFHFGTLGSIDTRSDDLVAVERAVRAADMSATQVSVGRLDGTGSCWPLAGSLDWSTGRPRPVRDGVVHIEPMTPQRAQWLIHRMRQDAQVLVSRRAQHRDTANGPDAEMGLLLALRQAGATLAEAVQALNAPGLPTYPGQDHLRWSVWSFMHGISPQDCRDYSAVICEGFSARDPDGYFNLDLRVVYGPRTGWRITQEIRPCAGFYRWMWWAFDLENPGLGEVAGIPNLVGRVARVHIGQDGFVRLWLP